MKKWRSTNWTVFITFLTLTACGEDDEAPREMLLLGTWNLSKQSVEQVTVSSGENELILTEEEFIQYLAISGEDLAADRIRLFSSNASFAFDEDHTCSIKNASNPEPILGNWVLDDRQQLLTLQVSQEPLLLDVVSISRHQMQANFTFNEIDEGTRYQIEFIFTFTK